MSRIMDAIHYDKIADKLINFYSKLPQEVDLELKDAINDTKNMKVVIAGLLKMIDNMAKKDQNGWIR